MVNGLVEDFLLLRVLFTVFVDMVEAKGEDLNDNVHKDFFPILFVFLFHKFKIVK